MGSERLLVHNTYPGGLNPNPGSPTSAQARNILDDVTDASSPKAVAARQAQQWEKEISDSLAPGSLLDQVIQATRTSDANVRLPTTLAQQRELAHLTTRVRDELINDFSLLRRQLSPGQIRAIVDEPWRMQLFFGTVVETRVASQIRNIVRDDPTSVLAGLQWTGRTNAPQDFIGPNQFGFDITGGSRASIRTHFNRPQIDAVVTYDSIPNDFGYLFRDCLNRRRRR